MIVRKAESKSFSYLSGIDIDGLHAVWSCRQLLLKFTKGGVRYHYLNEEILANLIFMIYIALRFLITFISNRSGCFRSDARRTKRTDERFGYGQGDFDEGWISFKVEMQTTYKPFWNPFFRCDYEMEITVLSADNWLSLKRSGQWG